MSVTHLAHGLNVYPDKLRALEQRQQLHAIQVVLPVQLVWDCLPLW